MILSYAELEAAYTSAMAGGDEPSLIVLPIYEMKRLCYATGEIRQWFAFVRRKLTDPAEMSARRLNPARLP